MICLILWVTLGMVRVGSSLLLGSAQSVKLKKPSNTSTNLILILVGLLVRCTLLFCYLVRFFFFFLNKSLLDTLFQHQLLP
jgi:hypothetical protein